MNKNYKKKFKKNENINQILTENKGINNKIISLSVNLMNKNCKIIRAGKDLHKLVTLYPNLYLLF